MDNRFNNNNYNNNNNNHNKNKNNDIFYDEDDSDLIQDDDEVINDKEEGKGKDTPFTPFAHQSRVFNQVIGGTNDLFRDLPKSDPSYAVKKRLEFGDGRRGSWDDLDGDEMTRNRNKKPVKLKTFEIKYRNDSDFRMQEKYVKFEAARMDSAVKQFLATHKKCKVLTVKLQLDDD